MMNTNYAFDIDVIAAELENAENLLRCFYEFWDNEGNADTEGVNKGNKALIFLQRMPQYMSIVFAAIGMIDLQKKNLDSLADKMMASRVIVSKNSSL